MNNTNRTLSIEDIESMSMSNIVELYGSGYKLDNRDVYGMDINTWLQADSCIGTDPNKMCLKNEYTIIAIGGVIALVLLFRN